MILELVKTAVLLLSLCLLQGINTRLLGHHPHAARISAGVIYGGICVIGMMTPINFSPGVIVDGRSAVLAMAGFFGGPLVGSVAMLIAAAYRTLLGGTGALTGVSIICSSMLLGLAYRAAASKGWVSRGPSQFLIFGVIVHLVALLLFAGLPAEQRSAFFEALALPYLLVLAPATALLGMLLQDLDNRIQTERALAGSEARLRAIAHAMPDLVLVLDEDGRYVEVISQNERLLVADINGLIGKRMHDVLPAQDADRFLELIRRTLDEDSPKSIEYNLQTLAGPRTFEGRCQVLETRPEDRPAVLFLARDISERVAAEQERRIAAIAFESQQGMIITDADTVMLRVNNAFTDITGYREAEVIGKKTRMLGSGRHSLAFYQAMWDELLGTGTWQGEVWNRRKNGETYPQALSINAVRDERGQVTHYVAALTDISLRKSTEEEIRTLAFFDHLTQLPNRRLLMDRLGQALALSARSSRYGALMFIDLDDFRNINDLLGHHNGDVLLQQAAKRLCGVAGESNTVARFGGDEFVVLVDELDGDEDAARQVAENIGMRALAALKAPYTLEGHTQQSSASVGIALFRDHERSVEELMKQADLSMNEAKHRGKNRLCFYDPVMQETVTARLRLEEEIRLGTEAGEFLVLYQPQYDQRGTMLGVEALVRWQHPKRGFVSPDQFIHVAERAGLMPALGLHVLNIACDQLAKWARRPSTQTLSIAVNISAQQLYSDAFVEQVLDALTRSGAPADRLTLELTESLLLDDMEEAIERMSRLRARGIRFSIDDFGTGYSSLSYLQRLPLDQLKIDRSFVKNLPDSTSGLAIVKAVIALAHALDLKVIAEGVELEAQRGVLNDNGCHHFQGFLFARPMQIEAVEALLQVRDAEAAGSNTAAIIGA
ncbi:histidine kinase [Parazoarcus communis]|uniref:Histidine kinase n=1 Tax=Parazoarcus communis TaxID=41977 RepID=A0A2U8H247_9RHOO|nr:EAL domain-containing protein [Parazoarcus communis]AWI79623.1 histidine kinase [Parazoarcus communis]